MLGWRGIGWSRGGRAVLTDVTGAATPGRLTLLVGPNGAGKSSLLTLLAGLARPDAGEVSLDGAPLLALSDRDRAQRIGYLPQERDIHWDIDVATLVGLGRLPHRRSALLRAAPDSADRAAVEEALAMTDCAHLARRRVQSLSGGEAARVLLARVLAGHPRWLLADEPLASLDPAHRFATLELLRRIAAAGKGVVAVLHDLPLAARFADHVLLMDRGRIVAAGPPDEVLTAEAIAQLFGVAAERLDGADGSRPLVLTGRVQQP